MAAGTWPGDLHVQGHLSANTQSGPTVAETSHVFRGVYSQPNTAATSETRIIHVARGAGTILSFNTGSIAAAVGNSTLTVDLKKNGASVLTGVVTLDNANTARVVETGTLSVTTLAAGDVLEVVTVATVGSGTLPTGVFASVNVSEGYAA